MQLYKNIPYQTGPEPKLLDLYLPGREEFDLLIYFHGGGLERGKKEKLRTLAERLAEAGLAVAAPNYSLYPEASFPDFIMDAADAVAFLQGEIERYGKRKRLFVGGSSAGAYLTAMLAYYPSYLSSHGISGNDISGYIINSAQMTTHYRVLRERGLDPRLAVIDEAAPIGALSPDSDFPRVFLLTADQDMPARYEQNLLFIQTLLHLGCPEDRITFRLMENATHCSYDKSEEYAKLLLRFIEET